jgi:hypothetical protein
MKVYSQWDNAEQTVIHSIHERDWTWTELHTHDTTVLPDMVRSVHNPVSVIVDMLRSPYFPPEAFSDHVRRMSAAYDDLNITTVVFVIREDDIGQLLLSAHRRFSDRRDYYTARSLDEARSIIAQAERR